MDCLVQENEDEVIYLKKKCNALLDTITVLKENLMQETDLKKEDEIAEKDIQLFEETNVVRQYDFDETDNLYLFFQSLKNMIKKALEEQLFIEYAYSSKYSVEFCKIEKNDFNHLIEELSGIEHKKFIDYCVDFLFLKAEHNRKCIYTSDKKQIYYFRRSLVKMLGGNSYIQ